MTGPTGQIGKNNMRELASLSIWLEEPEGRLLLCAGLGTSFRCFGFAAAGPAALQFVQDIPPGVLLPHIPHPAEHAWAAAPLAMGERADCGRLLERIRGKGWPPFPPLVHTFLPLENSLLSILIAETCS